MTKKDNEDFKSSTACLICDDDCFQGDVKVRDHCFITRKYKGPAHRDCNILVKELDRLNYKKIIYQMD